MVRTPYPIFKYCLYGHHYGGYTVNKFNITDKFYYYTILNKKNGFQNCLPLHSPDMTERVLYKPNVQSILSVILKTERLVHSILREVIIDRNFV